MRTVIASEAKQSRGYKRRLDRFVVEFIVGPAKKAGPVGSSQ
jgi:hypothetical protein